MYIKLLKAALAQSWSVVHTFRYDRANLVLVDLPSYSYKLISFQWAIDFVEKLGKARESGR